MLYEVITRCALVPLLSLTAGGPRELARGRAFGAGQGAASGPGLPVKLDVMVGELEVMQQVVREVTLRSEESGLVRQFTLDGPGSAGTIEVTRTSSGVEKITMNLDRLFLEKHAVPGAARDAHAQADGFLV